MLIEKIRDRLDREIAKQKAGEWCTGVIVFPHELEVILAVFDAAKAYQTYLPEGDLRGAGRFSEQNQKAKALHDAIARAELGS